MTDLSGRVDALESGLTSLEGQILALPTNSDISNFTQLISGKLNTIETSLNNHGDVITQLIQSFANLKNTILGIDTAFAAHTGTTTGEGVHGHQ